MSSVTLRVPDVSDGRAVHGLVVASGVLDVNSVYAYCATFRHFPDTCVVAESDGAIGGFVTGYRIPARPDVLFVWQVGVSATHRGQGLATRMLRWLLEHTGASFIETTVTPDNTASRALFHGLSRKLGTDCTVSEGLTPAHLGSDHAPEELFRIGPLNRSST